MTQGILRMYDFLDFCYNLQTWSRLTHGNSINTFPGGMRKSTCYLWKQYEDEDDGYTKNITIFLFIFKGQGTWHKAGIERKMRGMKPLPSTGSILKHMHVSPPQPPKEPLTPPTSKMGLFQILLQFLFMHCFLFLQSSLVLSKCFQWIIKLTVVVQHLSHVFHTRYTNSWNSSNG